MRERAVAQLELERKKIGLETERELSALTKRREAFEIEKMRLEIESLVQSKKAFLNERLETRKNQRQIDNRSHWFKMAVSTIFVGAGLALTFKGESLGAFLLGTGAGGAGIEAVSEIGKKRDGKELSISEEATQREVGEDKNLE